MKKRDLNQYLLTDRISKKNKKLYELAQLYDGVGYISKKLGEELEMLFDDEYVIGIHRTGYSIVNDDYLNDVFNNGLINNMDKLSGGFLNDPDYLDINKTATLFYDFIYMNAALKVTNQYKESQGSVIIKIPKSFLGLCEGEAKPIYYHSDENTIKLLSEYIYGYVSVKDGDVGDIIHNPNYSDLHTYIDTEDSLLYESKAKKGKTL